MKVLFLSAWYPTERDAMAGLFVQKHAQALMRLGVDVQVLYSEAKGVRWYIEMWRAWKRLKRDWGVPDVVQMNVLDKNGLLASWLKWRFGIPYVIIEHWSGYLPANFSFRGGVHGFLMRKIAKSASCIMPVSQMLEDAMKKCGIENAHWQRIHNVVDDFFYSSISPLTISPKPNDKHRLLHISCFDEKAKNIQGMLRAVRQVADARKDFELIVVGTGADYQQDVEYSKSLQFPSGILRFVGEQTPYEVAQWMQQSDMFLFFSRYENAPVVLSECIVTGLPVVSSRAGGIPEMINQQCGILVDVADEDALVAAIVQMLDHLEDFSAANIKLEGEKFSYQSVGEKLLALYQSLL